MKKAVMLKTGTSYLPGCSMSPILPSWTATSFVWSWVWQSLGHSRSGIRNRIFGNGNVDKKLWIGVPKNRQKFVRILNLVFCLPASAPLSYCFWNWSIINFNIFIPRSPFFIPAQVLNVSNTEFNKNNLDLVVEDLPLLDTLDISQTKVRFRHMEEIQSEK